jgi:hypothetical protein
MTRVRLRLRTVVFVGESQMPSRVMDQIVFGLIFTSSPFASPCSRQEL